MMMVNVTYSWNSWIYYQGYNVYDPSSPTLPVNPLPFQRMDTTLNHYFDGSSLSTDFIALSLYDTNTYKNKIMAIRTDPIVGVAWYKHIFTNGLI